MKRFTAEDAETQRDGQRKDKTRQDKFFLVTPRVGSADHQAIVLLLVSLRLSAPPSPPRLRGEAFLDVRRDDRHRLHVVILLALLPIEDVEGIDAGERWLTR